MTAYDNKGTLSVLEFLQRFLYLSRVRTRKDLTRNCSGEHSFPDETRMSGFMTSSSTAYQMDLIVRGFPKNQGRVVDLG